MAYRFKRVVVKVGSNVLARPDGSLDVTRMSALADQVAELHRGGVEVILVSSGAVASGRSEMQLHNHRKKLGQVSARQLSTGAVFFIKHDFFSRLSHIAC